MKDRYLKFCAFLIFMLLCPIIVDAVFYVDNTNAIEETNKYIENFDDREVYLVFGSYAKYCFNGDGICLDNNYTSGGLINLEEFKIMGKKESFVFNA